MRFSVTKGGRVIFSVKRSYDSVVEAALVFARLGRWRQLNPISQRGNVPEALLNVMAGQPLLEDSAAWKMAAPGEELVQRATAGGRCGGNAEFDSDSECDSDLESNSKPKPKPKPKCKPTPKRHPKRNPNWNGRKSEDELQRDGNVVRNQAVLASLGLTSLGLSSKAQAPTKKRARLAAKSNDDDMEESDDEAEVLDGREVLSVWSDDDEAQVLDGVEVLSD